LLIRTRGAYLPICGGGPAKLPRVRVVAIKELEKFSVADTELYV
jgi:hypothetical protein